MLMVCEIKTTIPKVVTVGLLLQFNWYGFLVRNWILQLCFGWRF